MDTNNAIKINDNDNVVVALRNITAGEEIFGVKAVDNIDRGHKMALVDIKEGENIIKYGYPIGHATQDIKAGEWVHSHNVKTNLSSTLEYTYNPKLKDIPVTRKDTFMGYVRKNGEVGIRNEIWVVNTVGCVMVFLMLLLLKLISVLVAELTVFITSFIHMAVLSLAKTTKILRSS